ncbi:MAG: MCP four helix bundle domain-containing protein [Verrucomicrobiia bacterium]
MKIKPGIKDILWMATGAAVLLICILVVLHFHKDQDPAAQLAFKARRVDLVRRMQFDLASASESEKSAVLAITDQDSQTFADQARAASAKVEQERRELGELLTAGGTPGEKDLLAQFTGAFAEFQRIDNDLLALAVKNTNLKAYSLAFGPAASALNEMDAALSRLVAANTDSPEAKSMMLLAFGAQAIALRIQTLLPPHIAEENDKKMDELEALMATEDAQVRKGLDGLAALPGFKSDPELATAMTRYAEFSKIKTQILALSRENTNVRSLSISLNQKRKVMLACQATLSTLQQVILAEPIAGVTYGTPVRPRRW